MSSFTTLFIFNLYKFFHIFHMKFLFSLPAHIPKSLIIIPDDNLAIMMCGAAQNVAILSWAECLDVVRVGLQLFCHSVALKIHHHHQTSYLTITLTCPSTPAIAARPYLKGGEDVKVNQQLKIETYLVFLSSSIPGS